MPEVYEALLCSRLTTDTGTILEFWELSNGDFELLTIEAHRPADVVGAVTLSLLEAELLAAKIKQATRAVRKAA